MLLPASQSRTTRHSSVGFTLIEVLIALVLFSIGILGVVALQSKAPGFAVNSENSTRAALLAADLEARMHNQGTIDLPASELSAWEDLVSGASSTNLSLPNSSSSVVPHSASTIPYAEVTIRWKDQNKTDQDVYRTRVFQW
jgi:type IV pilus assembly protein PilV